MHLIYYDTFETWASSFREIIVNLVGQELVAEMHSRSFEYFEDPGEFLAAHSDVETASAAIHEWLLENEFCVFHGTRLLPEEVISIREKGLLPLQAVGRHERLCRIFETHSSWLTKQTQLRAVIDDVGPSEKQGRREGQVHFSLSRSGLLNGFDHYVTYGSEFDQHVATRLFGDDSGLQLLSSKTDPVLVHVRMEGEALVRGAHPHFSYADVVQMGEIPGLAQTFLNTWSYKELNPEYDIAKLRTDCGMMQKVATPPDQIVEIELLSQHTPS